MGRNEITAQVVPSVTQGQPYLTRGVLSSWVRCVVLLGVMGATPGYF